MGKKGKGSKSKSPKSSKKEVSPEALIEFTNGTTEFHFENGDSYIGEFCAHRSGVVWREGNGVYTTRDGQVYEGKWKDDKLIENTPLTIDYPSGARYEGRLVKNKYSGGGCYIMENDLKLLCEFRENKPKGELIILRSDNECCFGAGNEYGAVFFRENIFYSNLRKDEGIGRCKMKPKQETEKSMEDLVSRSKVEFDESYWENVANIIFAKSTKTAGDSDFGKSPWYQNYLDFINKRDRVMLKIKLTGLKKLTEEEKRWYDGYMDFMQKRKLLLEKKCQDEGSNSSLLEKFLNEGITVQQTCIPTILGGSSVQPQGEQEQQPEKIDADNNDTVIEDEGRMLS